MTIHGDTRRLDIVGSGLRIPTHLSPESLSVLGEASRVLTTLSVFDVLSFPTEIRVKCEPLDNLFQPDIPRLETYQQMANLIVDAVMSQEGSVAFLTRGNPRVLNTITELLVRASDTFEYDCRVFPAISSFDSILIDVGYDPMAGVQLVEASAAVHDDVRLNPHLACLVYQPYALGSRLPSGASSKGPPALEKLQEYLCSLWAPSHTLAVVISHAEADGSAAITWTKVGALVDVGADQLAGGTLFIPPAHRPEVIDHRFDALVPSPKTGPE